MVDFAAINRFRERVEHKEIAMPSGAVVVRCTHPDYDGVIIGIHPKGGSTSDLYTLKRRLETTAMKELTLKLEWDFI